MFDTRVDVDVEQLKASVDGAKLDVRSAAKKFAEMDRRAGANIFLPCY